MKTKLFMTTDLEKFNYSKDKKGKVTVKKFISRSQ